MPSVDTVLELIHERRRRYALYYLRDRDGAVPVEELAAGVVEMETGVDRDEAADERPERVRIDLQHTHLPKARRAGIVEYDPDEEVAWMREVPSVFEAIVGVTRALETE